MIRHFCLLEGKRLHDVADVSNAISLPLSSI